MPGRKMDPMQARALASRMRRQYPRATTGQLKGMIDGAGNPMVRGPGPTEMVEEIDRSEYEGYTPVPGMTRTGYQGDDLKPLSQMSEQELYARGITPDRPIQGLRRMESSAAYGESDPMTGMTETEAFPESRQPISSRPSISATYDKMGPGGSSQAQFSLPGAAMDFIPLESMAMPVEQRAARALQGLRRNDFMEELTQSTDYGNAYADTISTRKDSASIEDLADVPMMYDTAQQKAMSMYQRTGKVPPSVAQELGSLAGLMDIKRDLEDVGSRELRESMMNFEREIQPGMDDPGDRDGR